MILFCSFSETFLLWHCFDVMTISYVSITNSNGCVLVDSSNSSHNCAVVGLLLLEKIQARFETSGEAEKKYCRTPQNSYQAPDWIAWSSRMNMQSINYDHNHTYHVMRDNNISFLCLTTGGTLVVPLRVVYGFLEALHKTFSTKFNVSKMETATTAYCLRSAFSADLGECNECQCMKMETSNLSKPPCRIGYSPMEHQPAIPTVRRDSGPYAQD